MGFVAGKPAGTFFLKREWIRWGLPPGQALPERRYGPDGAHALNRYEMGNYIHVATIECDSLVMSS
jgi:hypothetical protein